MVIKTKKREIIVPALTLAAVLILCLIGAIELQVYLGAKDRCTSEITGTVINTGKAYMRNKYDPGETKCQTGRGWAHIEIQPDGSFKRTHIYANRYGYKEGDTVRILYAPDDPEDYYVESYLEHVHKDPAVFFFIFGGTIFAGAVFLFIFFNIKPRSKAEDDR